MRKFTNKFIAAVLAFAMVFSVAITPAKADVAKKYAYLTIEKFTLGQGYVLEPTKVELKDNDTYQSVIERACADNKLELVKKESWGTIYISEIKNADTGLVNIPKKISNMEPYTIYGQDSATAAPTDSEIEKNQDSSLGEFDYTAMSGWMFMVNNVSNKGMADNVADGDVIRLQFTIFGYGLDLGYPDWNTGSPVIDLPNEDAAIKAIADNKNVAPEGKIKIFENVLANYDSTKADIDYIATAFTSKADKTNLNVLISTVEKDTKALSNDAVKAAYDNALKISADINVSQEIVDSATTVLSTAYQNYEAPVPSVGKVTIKSVKNVKTRKAKITINKVKGATGYEYKCSTKSNFKNAKTSGSTKTTFKTGKYAKKSRVYVKVRAYVKVNGTKYYGSWSTAKSVKIKK